MQLSTAAGATEPGRIQMGGKNRVNRHRTGLGHLDIHVDDNSADGRVCRRGWDVRRRRVGSRYGRRDRFEVGDTDGEARRDGNGGRGRGEKEDEEEETAVQWTVMSVRLVK